MTSSTPHTTPYSNASVVVRSMMDTVTPGEAVVTKVIAEGALSYSYTGVDRGTGDIVITMPKRPAVAGKTFQNVTVDEYGLVIGGVVGSAEGYEPLIQAGANNQVWHGNKQWKQLNTDDTIEGSLHLYYSDARARAAIQAGANITVDSGTGTIAVSSDPVFGSVVLSSGTAPASTTNKLYNIGGSLYWNGMLVGSNYSLPTASATVLGGIKVGAGLSIDGSGVLTAQAQPYTLPVATPSVLGGVKQGLGVVIAVDGTLSVNPLTRRTTFRIGNGSSNVFNCVHGFGTTGISVSIRRAIGTRAQVSHDNYLTPGDESNSVTIAFPASNIPAVNEYEVTVIANNAVLASTTTLTGLQDVVLTSITNGQVLVYMNGSWVNGDMSGGSFALSGLSDVTVSGLSADQLLKFNGTKWVNSSIGNESILNANNHAGVQWSTPQTGSMRINGIVQAGAFAVADPAGTSALEYTWQHQNGWFYAMLETNNDFTLGSYQDTGSSTIRHPAMQIRVSGYTPYRADFLVPLKLADATPADTSNALYSIGSVLYWNGAAVGSGSGSGYTLPMASDTVLGGIRVGANLSIDSNGLLSANPGAYTLPVATASVLGGVKPSTGLVVDGSGTLTLSPTPGLNYIDFNTSYGTPAYQTGRLYWDVEEITLSLGLTAGSVLQIGQELLLRALNNTGATITNGRIVYVSGAQGNRPTVALADATDDVKSKVVAVATQDVADNAIGFFTLSGLVHDIDTSMVPEGGEAWLSTTPGMMAASRPAAPNAAVCIGTVVRSHAQVGHLFVRINRGLKLSELGNVSLTAVQNGDVLKYSNGVWVNATETGGYTLPTASATVLGGVKVGTGLAIDGNGVLSATGSAPSNMVTTDTTQTITGAKTFSSDVNATNMIATNTMAAGYVVMQNVVNPEIQWRASSGNTDEKNWNLYTINGEFQFRLLNDAWSAANIAWSISRSGYAPSVFKSHTRFTAAQGVQLDSYTPSNTTNALYNVGGVLYWNGSAVGAGGGASALSALSDVTLTGSTQYDALMYNGTKWINAPLATHTILNANNHPELAWPNYQNAAIKITGGISCGHNLTIAENSGNAVPLSFEHSNGRTYIRMNTNHGLEFGAYNPDGSVISPAITVNSDGATPTSVDIMYALNVNKAISLASFAPSSTTGMLYNVSGTLYWNGSAVGAPSNMVTTDTVQTITGAKNFSVTGALTAYDVIVSTGDIYVDYTDAGSNVHAYGFNFRFNGVYRSIFRWNEQYDRFELLTRENNGSQRDNRLIVPRASTSPTEFNASGGVQITQGGLLLVNSTPSTTTNKLYNVSGTLYWNGSAIGGTPTNMVTTDTTQSISGVKTLTGMLTVSNRLFVQTQKSVHGEVNTIYTNVINDTDSGSAWALTAALRFVSGAGTNADGKGHTSFTTFQDGVSVASVGSAKARGFYAVSAQNDASNSSCGVYYGYQTLTGSGSGTTTYDTYASFVVDDETYTHSSITNRYGLLIRTGSIPVTGNWYGVYIEDGPVGATRYSIYTGTAPSRFGGGIEIADFVPSNTTNRLYNDAGALKWNNSPVLTKASLPSALSTDTEIKLLGFDSSGNLVVWTWHVGTEAPTGTPLANDLAFVVTPV